MSDVIVTKQVGKLTVNVENSEWFESPREFDNLGKMVFHHKRYDFPNEIEFDFESCNDWDKVEKSIKKKFGPMIMKKVWLYDHSGFTFSTSSFYGKLPQGHAEFDSGVVGFMFVTLKDIRKEYGKAGKKEIEKVSNILKNELSVYNKYVNNECYMFSVEDENENHIDSCNGYYDVNDALEAGVESAEFNWKEMQKSEETKKREKLESEGQLSLIL